jgi:hypothetical protein
VSPAREPPYWPNVGGSALVDPLHALDVSRHIGTRGRTSRTQFPSQTAPGRLSRFFGTVPSSTSAMYLRLLSPAGLKSTMGSAVPGLATVLSPRPGLSDLA